MQNTRISYFVSDNEIRRNTKCFVFRIPIQEKRSKKKLKIFRQNFSLRIRKSRISYFSYISSTMEDGPKSKRKRSIYGKVTCLSIKSVRITDCLICSICDPFCVTVTFYFLYYICNMFSCVEMYIQTIVSFC